LLVAPAPTIACYLRSVQKRILVVVERDAWVQSSLAASADGFEVVGCSVAHMGLNACCALEPDCLLLGIRPVIREDLEFLQAIRAQPGAVATTPILAMIASDRGSSPIGEGGGTPLTLALEAGADVVLYRPLEAGEVIAQARALIAMVARTRGHRRSRPSSDGTEGFMGDLERTPIASLLSTLEREQRSGQLEVTTHGATRQRLLLTIASGALSGGLIDTTPLRPIEAMRLSLTFSGRRFEFTPGPAVGRPAVATVGELLLEALRPQVPRRARDLVDVADLPAVSPKPEGAVPVAPPHAHRAARRVAPAPGSRLVESVDPSVQLDPRAEPSEPRPPAAVRAR
jgi:DNA-binding response OmpR family regulator